MEAPKEKERERDKEKDREREREFELEAAMYSNCLLLGLDSSVLGQSGGPRTGLFRHSNPRMGEMLLHFLLCALRGPVQSAKQNGLKLEPVTLIEQLDRLKLELEQ